MRWEHAELVERECLRGRRSVGRREGGRYDDCGGSMEEKGMASQEGQRSCDAQGKNSGGRRRKEEWYGAQCKRKRERERVGRLREEEKSPLVRCSKEREKDGGTKP